MKITICACASRSFIDKEKVAELAAKAQQAGMEVTLVDDLCELCEDKCKETHEIAREVVVACHPRAVKSLMAFVDEDDVKSLNLRADSVDDVLKQLQTLMGEPCKPLAETLTQEGWMTQIEAMPKKLGEDAWYPTIDKDVCCECGKCLEFCPFGVYEMVEDRVRVVHPHNCKNNCPACARTCPASAIIFAKYDRSPINGGEEREENAIKLDTKELFGQALREKLAARRTSIRLMK